MQKTSTFDMNEYQEHMQDFLLDIVEKISTSITTNDVQNLLKKNLYQLIEQNKIFDFAIVVKSRQVSLLIKRKESDPFVHHPISLDHYLQTIP